MKDQWRMDENGCSSFCPGFLWLRTPTKHQQIAKKVDVMVVPSMVAANGLKPSEPPSVPAHPALRFPGFASAVGGSAAALAAG